MPQTDDKARKCKILSNRREFERIFTYSVDIRCKMRSFTNG